MTREELQRKAAEVKPDIEPATLLGDPIWLKGLTGKQRDQWEQWIVVGKGEGRRIQNARGKLLARTICDETGKRLLLDQDAEWVGDLPGSIVAPLYDDAARLSGITEQTKSDLEKYSEDEGSGASSSGSPSA